MTHVDFTRYETYLDATNFPSTWGEANFTDFLKKCSEAKIARAIVHNTQPLRATLAFEGAIDLQSLAQKLSGKVIPGCDTPLQVKVCKEDSLKLQIATNGGEPELQEEMQKTIGLKANDWMRKPYKTHSVKYVLTYKTRDMAVNAYEHLLSFAKEKNLSVDIELYDSVEHPHDNKNLPNSTDNNFPNNLGHANNPSASSADKHAHPARSMSDNMPMVTDGYKFAHPVQPIPEDPLVPPIIREEYAVNQPVVYVKYFAPKGTPYYFNMATRKVQWEIPPANAVVVKPNFEPVYLPGYIPTTSANTENVPKPKSLADKGPPGCNVFIYNLPHEWTEKDIFLNFSPFGKMVNARVILDHVTKLPRGYGFASYDNQKSALKAVSTMEGFTVSGKRLQVSIKKDDFDFKQDTK